MEHEWKGAGKRCLYRDSYGNEFFSSPEAPVFDSLVWVILICTLSPIWIGFAFYILN